MLLAMGKGHLITNEKTLDKGWFIHDWFPPGYPLRDVGLQQSSMETNYIQILKVIN